MCLIFDNEPQPGPPPYAFSSQLDEHSRINPSNDQDIEFKTVLVEAAHFAFINYYNFCLNSDELRPVSKKCLNNYGFSVSLFESLETLYFLNMSDEFKLAKKMILNFKIEDHEYINLHEFWSRGIASLISIYQLSGDSSFLFKASQLVDQIITIKKGDFIDTKLRESSYIVSNKHFLSNWLSGVPEIIVLNELIHKPIYSEFITKTITEDPNIFIYPTRITKKHKYEPIFNFFTTSFIKNANLINQLLTHDKQNITLSPDSKINSSNQIILEKSNNLLKRFNSIKPNSLSELTLANQIFQFLNKIPSKIMENLENEKRFGDEKYMIGFHFKADEIFDLARRGKIDIVKNITLNSLKEYRTKNGFCGTTTSSIGKKYPDDIQHTEFLGEWLKVGAMIACGYRFLFKKGIFNEYGHILRIK